jgi:hypothetical protein
MAQFITGLLTVLLWWVLKFVFAVLGSISSWIIWLFWSALLLAGVFLGFSCRSANAGWGNWLWGEDATAEIGTRRLERAAELAHEAARFASQVSESQAMQAFAQADQNSRVADVLSQLSMERQDLAGYLQAIGERTAQDSQIAAVLTGMGPTLVILAVLCVASLSLWLVLRAGDESPVDLASTVDFLLLEDATRRDREPHGSSRAFYSSGYLSGYSSGYPERIARRGLELAGVARESSQTESEPELEEERGQDSSEPLPF